MDSKYIHQKEFRRSMRGYNEEEVDVFLDEVAEALDKTASDHEELKSRLLELQEKIRSYERMENTIQETLLSAQKTAEEVINKAKRDAELTAKDAEMRAKILLSQAEGDKDRLLKVLSEMLQTKDDFKDKLKSMVEMFLFKMEEAVKVEESKMEAFGATGVSVSQKDEARPDQNPTPEKSNGPSAPQSTNDILPNFLADGPRVDFLKDS